MRRLGGGRVANPYPTYFFPWWRRQIVAIDDYPYVGIDFRGDPDMVLPPGETYGDIGKESQTHFLSFELFNFLIYWLKRHIFGVMTHSYNLSCVCRCRTTTARRIPSSSKGGRRDNIMGAGAERTLQSILMNFVRLTHRVPMAQVKDLPEVMQCQVVGVPRAWVRLFRRLARAIVLYHDQNLPPPQA